MRRERSRRRSGPVAVVVAAWTGLLSASCASGADPVVVGREPADASLGAPTTIVVTLPDTTSHPAPDATDPATPATTALPLPAPSRSRSVGDPRFP